MRRFRGTLATLLILVVGAFGVAAYVNAVWAIPAVICGVLLLLLLWADGRIGARGRPPG